MDLKYIEITNTNIDYATRIQMNIFPEESAYKNYKYAIDSNLEYRKYYLVYNQDIVIGITGLYSMEDLNVTNSIWLGWFGVIEQYRKQGYGEKILLDTIEMARRLSKKYPIKYFRLYTSERDNPIAQKLYSKILDIKEYYNNKEDDNYNNTCLIYSKALCNNKVKYWNNKFLNLKQIIRLEEESNKLFKNI